MPQQHVVVWDPSGEYWEGGVVGEEVAHALAARGVVLLPCASRLFRRSAVGGFFKRSWGAGWPIEGAHPKMQSPLLLFAEGGPSVVHFAARLVPATPADAEAYASGGVAGAIRLAADSGQSLGVGGGFMPDSGCVVQLSQLGALDAAGGWTVRGRGVLHMPADGPFACALYGTGQGLRVAWAAVTQVPTER